MTASGISQLQVNFLSSVKSEFAVHKDKYFHWLFSARVSFGMQFKRSLDAQARAIYFSLVHADCLLQILFNFLMKIKY